MVFITFFGPQKNAISRRPPATMMVPLVVLAVFALLAGFVETPGTLGNVTLFSRFLGPVLPPSGQGELHAGELAFQLIAAVVSLAGIALAWFLYGRPGTEPGRAELPGPVGRFLFSGFGFDTLYDRLLVRPFNWIARVDRNDVIDGIYTAVALVFSGLWALLRRTQTGNIRWYAAGLALGALVTIAIVVFL